MPEFSSCPLLHIHTHTFPTLPQVTNRCETLTKMSLFSWRYCKIHCLLLRDQRCRQLPGQDYQPEAGAVAAPAAPLASWSNWVTARLSQQEGLYALLSCSYLQRASVHSALANIQPNVRSYIQSRSPPGDRGRKNPLRNNLPLPEPGVLDR